MNISILCDQIDCAFNKEMCNEITETLAHQCSHPSPDIALNLKFLKKQRCSSKIVSDKCT